MAQKQQLIDGFRGAGLDITLSETGVPRGDASQQLAVFRIVQEGLTNALRYAGHGAQVQLSLTHTPTDTRIEIIDSGKSQAARVASLNADNAPIPGSGKGLAGAAERARMFGGTFEAGAHGAGWRVTAIVPTADHSRAARESNSQEPRQSTHKPAEQSIGDTR
jgi:signal transduction histidine kinase